MKAARRILNARLYSGNTNAQLHGSYCKNKGLLYRDKTIMKEGEEMSNVFCPHCGNTISEKQQFCTSCGSPRPEQGLDTQPQKPVQSYIQQPSPGVYGYKPKSPGYAIALIVTSSVLLFGALLFGGWRLFFGPVVEASSAAQMPHPHRQRFCPHHLWYPHPVRPKRLHRHPFRHRHQRQRQRRHRHPDADTNTSPSARNGYGRIV